MLDANECVKCERQRLTQETQMHGHCGNHECDDCVSEWDSDDQKRCKDLCLFQIYTYTFCCQYCIEIEYSTYTDVTITIIDSIHDYLLIYYLVYGYSHCIGFLVCRNIIVRS